MSRRLRTPGALAGLAAALLALAAAVGPTATPALAAPGDLDPSFAGDGKLVHDGAYDFLLEESDFSAVTIEGGGRILAAGDSGLVRFNSDGTPDDSFSTEPDPPSLAAVALGPDGQILAAGHAHFTDDADFLLARYGPDGAPDRTFSGDGKATTDFAGKDDRAKAVALGPDGEIVVAGYSVGLDSSDVPSRDFAIARYKPDGSLDTGFSKDGKLTTDFGGDDVAYDVALQPDGKIVVAGSSSGNLALARYRPDGRLDRAFSGNAKVEVGFGDRRGAGARGVALQGDGRIVAAGGESGKFTLARFKPDGSRDSSFGGDGIVTTSFTGGNGYPPGASAADVVLQSDRLLAAGRANGEFALARYDLDGKLDPGFSGDGKLKTDFGRVTEDGATAIAIEDDGKIVAAGTSTLPEGHDTEPQAYGAIARYLVSEGPADADADGLLDSADLCPHVFASQERDGCPRFGRSITLEVGTAAFYGAVDSGAWGCAEDTRLSIYRVRRHRRTVVARATPYYDDLYGDWEYYVEARVGRGRYYSKLTRELRPGVGWCLAARSPSVRPVASVAHHARRTAP